MVYNEEITRKYEDPSLEENPHKVYVDVYVRHTSWGEAEPFGLDWITGRHFHIDRIKSVCRAASRKAGGCGMRYTCIINGHEVELFDEENGKWFVTANET